MRCPRCTLSELSDAAATCWLCGYSGATVAVAEAPTPEPSELDARRELAAEFRIDSLLERPPGPIVYLARDADERVLAVKVLPRAEVGPAEDHFHAAAEAAAQLDHPHIVPVYRHGATENFLWCTTKHVEGRSLASMLQVSGPLERSACLRIFEQVASALDYAHRRGVPHGALTPDSIIVEANEWVLVGDFAMRGLVDAAPDGARATEPPTGADQRALAAIAYHCFTGTPLGEDPLPADDGLPGLPLHASQALRRALSSRQAERFPTVIDFVAALGGTRPDARTTWFGANPRKRGAGSPVVIVDADADPAAKPLGGRIAAAGAGLLVLLGGGAAWLGISSIPASGSREREPVAGAPAPRPEVAPAPPRENRDTVAPSSSTPPPARPTRPTVTQRAAVVRRWTPPPAAAPPVVDQRLVEPGLLSVNAIPWGSVYLDGQPIGNTPQIDRTVGPGRHRLRVERDGYRPYDRMIDVAPGQRLRITDIALVER
ncbi:MAG TPA: protein kinase [Gemmatimonadales bacterium]|nr:protein kinase [Gemmatimonadales bacterium]